MRLLSLTLYKRTQHLIKNDAVTMDESDFPAFLFLLFTNWHGRHGRDGAALYCIALTLSFWL